jgi:hypothetical protein
MREQQRGVDKVLSIIAADDAGLGEQSSHSDRWGGCGSSV